MRSFKPVRPKRVPGCGVSLAAGPEHDRLVAWIVRSAPVALLDGRSWIREERETVSGRSYIKLATEIAVNTPAREDVGYFFINNFLLSRIDSEMPSDLKEYDEDVNVYTASLLAGVVTGQQDLLQSDFISTRDADVFARVQGTKDQRLRYRVYKANADFLYVSLGLFGETALVGDVAETEEAQTRLTGRGKSYYQFASAYAERLFGRGAAIAEVMDKLSRNFEAYTKIMVWMSGEYLHLMDQLSSGEMYHLEHDTQEHFEKSHKASTWDELLDSYVEWQKCHGKEARRRVARAARELRRIDPTFSLREFRRRWARARGNGEPRRLPS